MNKKHIIISLSLLSLFSCKDEIITPEVEVPQQSENVATMLTQYNANIAALQYVSEGQATVVALTDDGKVSLDNNMELALLYKTETDADIPAFGIDEEGYWKYILNGDTIALTDLAGNAVPALKKAGQGTFTPQVSISEDGYWQMSINGYQWKKLSDKMAPSLNDKAAESYALFKSTSTADGKLTVEPFIGSAITLELPADDMAEAWRRFIMKTDDNVLLDYSYAGYNYGESAPADGFAWGYKVINVKEVMTENSLSAREALEKILDDNSLIRKTNTNATNSNARIVIYFPEGKYVLQENTTRPLPILGGNFVIKGDGPEKTKLIMNSHIGTDEGSSGALITIQHSNSPRNTNNSKSLGNITQNASKGDFTVYGSFSGITPGTWVQLRLRSNDEVALQKELGPLYEQKKSGWSIINAPGMESNGTTEDGNGIRIIEFHKVKSATGTSVTFYDPIMSDIDASINDYNGGWEIREYKCYENVGIEDLSFVGNAPTPYYHHGENAPSGSVGAWMYDSSYKPVLFMRVVNSWIRNVKFISVSEAVSFDQSAFCSAYNITIDGVRGHSAVRAQESTRIFIGKVKDESADENTLNGKGQWHGCGVSKPSIGTVIWNVNWGENACFEAHATQPRATLLDICSGGLIPFHSGGAETEVPNHLRDLTLWNLNVTGTTNIEKNKDYATDFEWWFSDDIWWKVYPPIVVGTHGKSVTFAQEEGQLTYEESTGTMVSPESLYEAQLQKRLGYVPAWLKALK